MERRSLRVSSGPMWGLIGATTMLVAAGAIWAIRAPAAAQKAQNPKRAAKRAKARIQPPWQMPKSPPEIKIDEAAWPADDTVTVWLRFGLSDTQPTDWSGRIQSTTDCRLLRVRGWRFGAGMTADTATAKWTCRSWLGREPRSRPFEVHLPDQPRPFVRPGLLIDLKVDNPRSADVAVHTAQGDFHLPVGKLLAGAAIDFLEGRVRAIRAVFARPLAAGSLSAVLEQGGSMWHDYPSVSVSPTDPDDVWFCYQTYCQEAGGERIMVRRRLHGRWLPPEPVSPDFGDFYRTALCHDGKGALWVVTSAQNDGNWDLYGRRYADDRWEEPIRLTHNDQPDVHHTMVRAQDGSVWLVWQSFRDGQSDIYARRWDGQRWGEEIRVSQSPANDWEPSAAAHPQGGIAVAWDSYDAGQYDVFCRHVTQTKCGPVIRVTGSPNLEARASVACDRKGRLWIAYDMSGPAWGKDTGFWLEVKKLPQGTRLYKSRWIGVSLVDVASGTVLTAPTPTVKLALDKTLHEQIEYQHLLTDPAGRLWMFFRKKTEINVSKRGVGWRYQWELYVTRFDPATGRWTEPRLVADSAGRLDMRPAWCVTADRIWAAWACNHRLFVGSRPDVCNLFAGSIELADQPSADVAQVDAKPAPAFPPPKPDPAHANESADIARIRAYTIPCGQKVYRIFRGDLHRHTENSPDGGSEGSLLDAYRYALDAARMDFLLVTDHNDGGREYDWWQREKSNDLFRIGEAFVGLYGYERSVGYPNGHRNVFFLQRGVRPLPVTERQKGKPLINSGSLLYPYLRKYGGICFSHTSATGMGTDWRDNDPKLEPLVEIFQGDRTNYEAPDAPWAAKADDPATQEGGYRPLGFVCNALAKGYRLGFQASSDHLSTHLSYACILAERNTREALMDAMRQRHSYAANDNIIMDVRSEGVDGPKIMGDVFACRGAPSLRVKVIGTDKLREVSVIKDNQVVYTTKPSGSTAEFTFTDAKAEPGKESFYYVRAVQENERLAWASPMWITPAK
ncbi:MAG: hypothetical protein GXP27_22225 [Planctomycetes bacterium]|nr:hypothetical protein [Planctomycetota bacterium]